MTERVSLEICCKEWSLCKPELMFESGLADVYRVLLPSGEFGALKLFTPHGLEDEWDGAKLLQWYAGKGAAKVLALGHGALLMEWLGGGNLMSLCDNDQTDDAARIVARLAAEVRVQAGPPPPLKTIEQRFKFLFIFDEAKIPMEFLTGYRRAKEVAHRMMQNVEHVPLHGDIHFKNVLFDGQEWRLIDPKGLMGPPAYDLANLFINPWDRPKVVMADGRAAKLATVLSKETGILVSELVGWAIAHAAIAATWEISAGGSGRHPLQALDVLFGAQGQIG